MTIWISHRGYCARAQENSLAAFDAAVASGFRHLETDLRCSRDGHIVLNHDRSLLRFFGINRNLEDLNLKELLGIRSKDGHSLYEFDHFISRFAAFDWTLDIKPETSRATLEALKLWAQQNKAEDWLSQQGRLLLWSRQDQKLAARLFPYMPQLATEFECYRAGLSSLARMSAFGGIERGKTYSLPRFFAGFDLFRTDVTIHYHRRGARVLAYLPRTAADVQAAIDAAFDEILTNDRPLR